MKKNQINHSLSIKSRRLVIASIILGIISLIGSLLPFLPTEISGYILDYYDWQWPAYFSIFIPLAIFGLILGIVTRKSSKLGMILSIIALLILAFWYFIYLGFSHMAMK